MSTLLQLFAAAPSAEISVEGFDYRISDAGVDGALRFVVAAADLQPLLDVIAGLPATPISIGGTSTTRMIPLQFPRNTSAYAYSARAYPPDGIVANEGPIPNTFGIDFEWYFVDVQFRTPKWSPTGAYPMVSFDRDSSIEMRTLPGTGYKFPSDDLRILHDVGQPNLVTQFALNFEGLTSLNNTLYDSLIGKTNSTTFYGYPADTVLYLGCSSSGQYQIGGVPAFRARQQFVYSRIPHRQIMRPDGAGYEAPVQVGNTSKYLFDSTDLNSLNN